MMMVAMMYCTGVSGKGGPMLADTAKNVERIFRGQGIW